MKVWLKELGKQGVPGSAKGTTTAYRLYLQMSFIRGIRLGWVLTDIPEPEWDVIQTLGVFLPGTTSYNDTYYI